MFALFTIVSLSFYLINAAPMLSGNTNQKMVDGQSSYQSFNLFDLPVVAKRPVDVKASDVPILANHKVKADLAVVSSAEVDTNEGPYTGYGEAKPSSSDMFVINAPENVQNSKDSDFKPIGVVPKLTGSLVEPRPKSFTDKSGAAITNPTAYFLEGADLDKIEKPKCRMVGCDGPVVDDDIMIETSEDSDKAGEKCQQVFVPIVDAQIRVGMSCRVCCDSSALLKELKKTRLDLKN